MTTRLDTSDLQLRTPADTAVPDGAPQAGVAGSELSRRRQVRVAFCLDNLGVGGTELNAVRLAERLDRSRFDVTFVCFRDDGPLAERLRRHGVPIACYDVASLASVHALRQASRFARFLQRERIQLVHCHDRYSNAFGVFAARLAGVPVIASKRWGEAMARHRLTGYFAFRYASTVLANSPSVVESLQRDDGVAASRVVLVPNFVDDDAFTPMSQAAQAALREELNLQQGAPTIGIIASLRPVKDHPTLLRAMALLAPRIPGVRLLVVGEGESRKALEDLANELGIRGHVRFTGLRPQSPSMHWMFDVSVLCSRNEGFPNSLLEAMAAGNPVVAVDVPGIRDAVRHEETGLLVRGGDPAALAHALERVLTERALARRFGDRGREWVRHDFNAETVVNGLQSLYDRLLQWSAA